MRGSVPTYAAGGTACGEALPPLPKIAETGGLSMRITIWRHAEGEGPEPELKDVGYEQVALIGAKSHEKEGPFQGL
jgi:hypothetical protein